MKLSNQQQKQLQEALIDAFPNAASLKQMLSYELDKNLEVITGEGKNLQDIIFILIQTANSQGWIKDLVCAAHKSNPGNLLLKATVQELLLKHSETPQMLNVFNQTPKQAFINDEFLIFILCGAIIGVIGVHFIPKSGIFLQSQTNKAPLVETAKDVEEVTIRVAIRNAKTKASIPNVSVQFECQGIPINDYTDSAGYIDVKITKTEYIKIYLSKPGFESVNYRLDPNIKNRNIMYYLKEVTSPSVDTKATSSSSEKITLFLLPQQDKQPKWEEASFITRNSVFKLIYLNI